MNAQPNAQPNDRPTMLPTIVTGALWLGLVWLGFKAIERWS